MTYLISGRRHGKAVAAFDEAERMDPGGRH